MFNNFLSSIELMQWMHDKMPPYMQIYYKDRLAHYFDTIGWAFYRMNLPEEAEAWLSSLALKYNQDPAFIDYHLARVYLRLLGDRLEAIVQRGKDFPLREDDVEKMADYLRNAFHHWNNAYRLDETQNYLNQLRVMRQRIEKFRHRWDDFMTAALFARVKDKEDKAGEVDRFLL